MSMFSSLSLSRRKKKSKGSTSLSAYELSEQVILMSGELRKKGKVNKAFKSRWCELSQNSDSYILSYYLSEINKTICGSINTLDIFQLKVINYDENEFDDFKLPQHITTEHTSNISDLKYSFILCTLGRNYILAAPNKLDFTQWIELFHKYVHQQIIHHGQLLLKREKTSNTWDSRYFVLNEFKHLRYYEHEGIESFQGGIPLSDIGVIKNGKVYDDAHKYTLNLHSKTQRRKWVLCCKDIKEREKWQSIILQIRADEDDIDNDNDMIIDDMTQSNTDTMDRDIFSEASVVSNMSDVGMMKCPSIKSCQSLNNICSALNFFSAIVNRSLYSHDTHGLLIHYFEEETGKTLLNDYAHMLSLHLNNKRDSSKVFGQIYHKICKFTMCDFNMCVQYNRNTRSREHQKVRNDLKISYYIDIMDTIHCMFLHSYDIGYRVQSHVKENDYNKYSKLIKEMRDKNRPKRTDRFTMHIAETVQTRNILRVGQRVNYWEEFDDYFVFAHFASLKEEIVDKIKVKGYDFTMYKAQEYHKCEWAKRIKITLEQILAVMIYTDYDILAQNMRKTFVNTHIENDIESRAALLRNIGEYAHVAKLLTEVVDGYGDNAMTQHKSNMPSFYVSLDKSAVQNITHMQLDKLILCGIHSTTASIEVILSNHRGIVMELNHMGTSSMDLDESEDQWQSWHNTTYFKTSFLSSRGYENEIIFTNTFAPLRIPSINVLDHNKLYWINCKPFMDALVVFKKIMNGADDQHLRNAQKHMEIILKLLRSDDKIPETIGHIFKCIKEDTTEINIDIGVFAETNKISDYFISDYEHNILNYNALNALFPNITVIAVKSNQQKISVSENLFDAIYNVIDEINNKLQFQQIVVINPDILCDIDPFKDRFIDKGWFIHNYNNLKLSITRTPYDIVVAMDADIDDTNGNDVINIDEKEEKEEKKRERKQSEEDEKQETLLKDREQRKRQRQEQREKKKQKVNTLRNNIKSKLKNREKSPSRKRQSMKGIRKESMKQNTNAPKLDRTSLDKLQPKSKSVSPKMNKKKRKKPSLILVPSKSDDRELEALKKKDTKPHKDKSAADLTVPLFSVDEDAERTDEIENIDMNQQILSQKSAKQYRKKKPFAAPPLTASQSDNRERETLEKDDHKDDTEKSAPDLHSHRHSVRGYRKRSDEKTDAEVPSNISTELKPQKSPKHNKKRKSKRNKTVPELSPSKSDDQEMRALKNGDGYKPPKHRRSGTYIEPKKRSQKQKKQDKPSQKKDKETSSKSKRTKNKKKKLESSKKLNKDKDNDNAVSKHKRSKTYHKKKGHKQQVSDDKSRSTGKKKTKSTKQKKGGKKSTDKKVLKLKLDRSRSQDESKEMEIKKDTPDRTEVINLHKRKKKGKSTLKRPQSTKSTRTLSAKTPQPKKKKKKKIKRSKSKILIETNRINTKGEGD